VKTKKKTRKTRAPEKVPARPRAHRAVASAKAHRPTAKKPRPKARPKKLPLRWPRNKSKLDYLPGPVKTEMEQRLRDGLFGSYDEISKWLSTKGIDVGRSSVARYHRKFERDLEAVRRATEQARAVCQFSPEDDVAVQGALIRLVQTELFKVLISVKRAKTKARNDKEPTSDTLNIHVMARTVTNLAKVAIGQSDWAQAVRAKVQKGVDSTKAAIDKAQADGGLTPAAAEAIREALYGVGF
jgi:hypothetical protein